jgi:hypothetical protein
VARAQLLPQQLQRVTRVELATRRMVEVQHLRTLADKESTP